LACAGLTALSYFLSDHEKKSGARPPHAKSTLHLIERTLLRLLIRTPAQELCAVTKAAAGEVIVLNFNDQSRCERFPFG